MYFLIIVIFVWYCLVQDNLVDLLKEVERKKTLAKQKIKRLPKRETILQPQDVFKTAYKVVSPIRITTKP